MKSEKRFYKKTVKAALDLCSIDNSYLVLKSQNLSWRVYINVFDELKVEEWNVLEGEWVRDRRWKSLKPAEKEILFILSLKKLNRKVAEILDTAYNNLIAKEK